MCMLCIFQTHVIKLLCALLTLMVMMAIVQHYNTVHFDRAIQALDSLSPYIYYELLVSVTTEMLWTFTVRCNISLTGTFWEFYSKCINHKSTFVHSFSFCQQDDAIVISIVSQVMLFVLTVFYVYGSSCHLLLFVVADHS